MQVRPIATELLSHVAIGPRNNLTRSRPQAFIASFFFALQGYLRSQVSLVAIWHELCKHHA